MNILSAQNLSKSFGLKLLFENLSFGLDERDRVGLIGVNGCGKSTLLKILAGLEPAESGQVAMRQGLRVTYLPQDPAFDSDQRVLDYLFAANTEVSALVGEYETLCHAIERAPEDEALLARMHRLTERMDAAGAWELETRAKTILGRLGITDLDAPLGRLSGGLRKRVALAHALVEECDLLLLDEPTNHLDADTVAWLESYLARFPGALVLVTHDRYFLDRVATRLAELDGGEVRLIDGNYAKFLETKAQVEADLAHKEQRRLTILRRELEWLKRGPKARATKQKARIDRAHELQETSFARSKQTLTFEAATRRMGKKVVEIEGLCKSFGERPVVREFTHVFTPGERLGVVGPNGCGKTTLSRMICGKAEPDSGSIEVGPTISFGVYEQESPAMDLEMRAIDYVKREGGEMLRGADGSVLPAALALERFYFTSQMQYAPIGKLSGGERRRLYLVQTLMRDPNFLILDEPTNDLDISTLQALEDFLENFAGCLLVISHDRYFLDRTVDRIASFEEGGHIRLWPGDYTTYAQMREEEQKQVTRSSAAAKPQSGRKTEAAAAKPKEPPRKLSYKEQRELEALEKEIERLEKRQGELLQELAAASSDYTRLHALSTEQSQAVARLEEAMARWEELAARAANN